MYKISDFELSSMFPFLSYKTIETISDNQTKFCGNFVNVDDDAHLIKDIGVYLLDGEPYCYEIITVVLFNNEGIFINHVNSLLPLTDMIKSFRLP